MKYSNGYAGKISYWSGMLNKAIAAGDLDGMNYAFGKLQYFVKRQVQVYGSDNTIAGIDFSESLNLLKSL
jgi:hypothetical protein